MPWRRSLCPKRHLRHDDVDTLLRNRSMASAGQDNRQIGRRAQRDRQRPAASAARGLRTPEPFSVSIEMEGTAACLPRGDQPSLREPPPARWWPLPARPIPRVAADPRTVDGIPVQRISWRRPPPYILGSLPWTTRAPGALRVSPLEAVRNALGAEGWHLRLLSGAQAIYVQPAGLVGGRTGDPRAEYLVEMVGANLAWTALARVCSRVRSCRCWSWVSTDAQARPCARSRMTGRRQALPRSRGATRHR